MVQHDGYGYSAVWVVEGEGLSAKWAGIVQYMVGGSLAGEKHRDGITMECHDENNNG